MSCDCKQNEYLFFSGIIQFWSRLWFCLRSLILDSIKSSYRKEHAKNGKSFK